jgi:lipoprotein-anchoring transpeptidase ErfK/SrfK
MDKKELEEQLEAFFEHNPLDDDMVYLKQFVKEHPDNKMGWYLLGKEYAVRDKQGKAKYCFAQAGEVYEAFEKKKIKLSLMDELKADQTVLPGQAGRRKKVLLAARMGAAILAAVLLGSYLITDHHPQKQEEAAPPAVVPETPQSGVEFGQGLRILYTNPLLGRNEGELWKRLAQSAKVSRGRTLLVEGYMTSDGKWVNGLRAPELLMSGSVSASGDQMQVSYHKAEYCNCTPQKAEGEAENVKAWVAQQEQDVILRSAVAAYQARYGAALPDTLDGIMRDYPNNVLPGYTEEMSKSYTTILGSSSAPPAGQGQGQGQDAGGSSAAASGSTLYTEPLSIVVDRKTYRLALVSGSVILRSYPVGLGGDKTPEGTFRISEKVKNPNGRDDGDFGSRGMQLSDTNYAIHGTNEPKSIGQDQSLGCIRMLKADIEELFDMAPSGTRVTIGEGLLPADTIRKESPFSMPALREEKNPGKVYRWL